MGRRIVVADDIQFVRETISEILTAAHFQVVGEAADGDQACEMFEQLRPDLITMDIVMPKMSGIDATLKLMKRFKDAKILIVSAMGQEHMVMEAIHAGARDFLLKPFSSTELVRAVERILSHSERNQNDRLSTPRSK
jgi:two-component system chemotaxis response regulator CheY